MTKKTDVTENVEQTELAVTDSFAVAERPAWMKDKGRGNEEITNDDITLPRLSIIQDLSPQHKKNKEEYIDGAEVGMMFNTVTQALYKSIVFCPVKMVKEYILWKDRKAGGGFGGSFSTELEAAKERMKQDSPDQWEVIDTDTHYGLMVSGTPDKPVMEEIVISMSKGSKKVSRNLNTVIKLAGGDRFSRLYQCSVVDDLSKNGDDYKNYKFNVLGYTPELVYCRAEETYDAIEAGLRKVHVDDSEVSTESSKKSSNTDSATGEILEGDDF